MIYFKKQRLETVETVERERERERATLYKNEIKNNQEGITLIALVITIVLNRYRVAMERMLNRVNILKI